MLPRPSLSAPQKAPRSLVRRNHAQTHPPGCTAVPAAPTASESIRAEISEARRHFLGEKTVSERLL